MPEAAFTRAVAARFARNVLGSVALGLLLTGVDLLLGGEPLPAAVGGLVTYCVALVGLSLTSGE